ncbi:MAG: helix-turn-helix domain-containing protein [Flavobacteriales bacterium]|jgi:transcriptional regulator with XRE-family HTH domain|nr:helix-turn-helix domain-containing protein [Flavobacteriales bacterium]
MSTFGKNIKKIRKAKNLSQLAFAELFDLKRPTLGAYEEDRSMPKIDTVIRIANHFGISIDILLTQEVTINQLSNITDDLLVHGLSSISVENEAPVLFSNLLHGISISDWQESIEQSKKMVFPFAHFPFDFVLKLEASLGQFQSGDWLFCTYHQNDDSTACLYLNAEDELTFSKELRDDAVYINAVLSISIAQEQAEVAEESLEERVKRLEALMKGL